MQVQDEVAHEKEINEAETEQNKEVFGKIVTEETIQHSIETLQHTEIKEANISPDKYDFFVSNLKAFDIFLFRLGNENWSKFLIFIYSYFLDMTF